MRFIRYGLFFVFAITVNTSFAVSEPTTDVRVIIDVSGSMKKNDPKNLRAPALRMLVGLMPEKTKSGVWTFGKFVNMQVKHGSATEQWKKQALLESEKIHSRGLYTNIEDALKRTTRGWETNNRKERRHLILLTDGMVDISKDQALNEASQKRILNSIIPQLKKSGVKIHTIALSKNADKKLMAAIAGMTDGWHEAVDNAEDLQRVFLHIFEKASNVDTVPLENNNFTIDKSIEDMTVLVFRKSDASETELITPSKSKWSHKEHPKNVTWYQDTGYDLISAKNPEHGDWMINAALDPDNRVMVVTNLKLVSGNFPNNIMYGDILNITAKLVQEDKTVTQEKLLKLVKFSLGQQALKKSNDEDEQNSAETDSTEIDKLPMLDDGKISDSLEKDGVYSVSFNSKQDSGDITLTIQAKSPVFEREVKHIIKVHSTPADLNVEAQADGSYKVEVTPRMELLVPHTVSIQVTLPDGTKSTLQQGEDEKWHAVIPKIHAGKLITITLVGTRVNDKQFHVEFEKILETSTVGAETLSLNTDAKTEETPSAPVIPPPAPIPSVAPVEDKTEPKEDDKQEDTEGFDWLSTMMVVIYANVILLIIGGIGFLIWCKRKSKIEKEQEELSL